MDPLDHLFAHLRNNCTDLDAYHMAHRLAKRPSLQDVDRVWKCAQRCLRTASDEEHTVISIFLVHLSPKLRARMRGDEFYLAQIFLLPAVYQIEKYHIQLLKRGFYPPIIRAPNGSVIDFPKIPLDPDMYLDRHPYQISPNNSSWVSPWIEKFLLSMPGCIIAGGFAVGLFCQSATYSGYLQNSDMDIFIVDGTLEDAIYNFMQLVEKSCDSAGLPCQIYDSTRAISFSLAKTRKWMFTDELFNYEIQFIKTKFLSVEQVLSSFDIDSACCALQLDKEGKVEFAFNDRFTRACTYGNIVGRPGRAGRAYNKRLVKYADRGFPIILPGGRVGLEKHFELGMTGQNHKDLFSGLIQTVLRPQSRQSHKSPTSFYSEFAKLIYDDMWNHERILATFQEHNCTEMTREAGMDFTTLTEKVLHDYFLHFNMPTD